MHLGGAADVDLFRALGRGPRGEASVEQAPRQGGQVTALFPREWPRDRASAFRDGESLDAPSDHPSPLDFMPRAGGGDAESFKSELKASATPAA